MEAQLAAQQLLYEANNCVRVMGYKEVCPYSTSIKLIYAYIIFAGFCLCIFQ